jgi:hypothetical protein
VVETLLENVAVFPTILLMLRLPFGLLIAVELRVNRVALLAVIVLYTVRLSVLILFEAVRLRVLMPGTVTVSENRRSFPRYVIYFSLNDIEFISCRVFVVKVALLTAPWTNRLDLTLKELEKFAVPPIAVVPLTSSVFAITPPFNAVKFPRVIISPRAPKFPRVDIFPRTKRLDPVLTEPVNCAVPSTN